MPKGVFVSGTDTGVGKTVVAAALGCCLRRLGVNTAVMKAVQTGAIKRNGAWVSEDLQVLLQGLSLSEPRELLNPYCLPEPCSPHLAARLAGTTIEHGRIIDAYEKLWAKYDAIIVEGAGGLLVPLREDYLMADLAGDLGLPLLLVADNKLGVINHSLLSIECARKRGLEVAGLVINHTQKRRESPVLRDNPRIIAKAGRTPVLGELPYCPGDMGAKIAKGADCLAHSLLARYFM